jgi:hypothetical protein
MYCTLELINMYPWAQDPLQLRNLYSSVQGTCTLSNTGTHKLQLKSLYP